MIKEQKMPNNDKVQEITDRSFEDFIKNGNALVDFYADWCMPCLIMSPIVEELAGKLGKKIKFGKINVDENQKTAQKFNVSSIPSFILFKNGEIVNKFFGSMSSDDFEGRLKKFL